MRTSSFAACFALAGGCALALLPASCTTKEPATSTYFERAIAPILTTSCVRTNTGSGCHVADDKGNAFGNLDLASFGGVSHRRDLLADYGPYGQPAMLVKNVPPFQVAVQSYDGSKAVVVTTDIKHTGGTILNPTASAYQTLRRWIENGATANNSGPAPATQLRLPCAATLGVDPAFDPSTDPTNADFATFRDRVNPVFSSTCAAGNCHGTTVNELYLTCGTTAEQVRWNYFAASDYLAGTSEQSELLRRPLAPAQGGSFHEGGVIFTTSGNDGYQALLAWATEHGPPSLAKTDPAFDFFSHSVQPILVKKGCMMLQCHSAAMFHDYRLRGGSGGSFSLSATKRNYALTLAQLAVESDDVTASRIVRKNLFRAELSLSGHQVGLAHRGGPLLEDFPTKDASPALCDAATPPYAYDDPTKLDSIPAFCILREWHKRERAARVPAPMSAIVYVKRAIPAGPDRAQDFDVYAPGAELHVVKATMDAAGKVTLGADAVLSTACGLDKATADIRRPSVSWDGTEIAFAARASGGDPLQVYTMATSGQSCAKHADIDAGPLLVNGALVHNFDPVFSPPDANGVSRIVFASTRGNLATAPYDYSGPQRTPADPSKLNANLYVWEPDPASAGKSRIRQETFLLDMERYPSFMQDGRLIFSAEKRAPNFYEIALRRMNLDGGDYHPLFAQRGSVGYYEAREVVELGDKNFAAIFSDPGTPHGGGALGIFNRSIGLDFTSADAADYPIDPSVIDPAAPASPEPAFFLHSLSFADASVSGHAGQSTTGVYTSPAALPNASLLVSFGAAADAASFGGDYDLYVFDRTLGTKTKLLGDPGTAEVDAVAVFGRAPRGIFQATGDEPNAFVSIHEGAPEADVTILDVPVLASLLFQNTPTGRLIDDLDHFDLYEDLPPTPEVTSFDSAASNLVFTDKFGKVYVRRRRLGSVPVASDGSARFVTFGGLPLVMHLPDTATSKRLGLPRYQREEMEFAPGEYGHQAFKRQFFDNLCGNCHGSISGRALDNAVAPDILTQASDTASRTAAPIEMRVPPGQRGAIEGPPATP